MLSKLGFPHSDITKIYNSRIFLDNLFSWFKLKVVNTYSVNASIGTLIFITFLWRDIDWLVDWPMSLRSSESAVILTW